MELAEAVYRALRTRPCRDWQVTQFFLHPWVRNVLPARRVAVLETLCDIECQLRHADRELRRLRDPYPHREALDADDIAVLRKLGFEPIEARA